MSNTDNLTGAGIGIDLGHERIHSGKAFVVSYKTPDDSPIADNGVIDILIVNGAKPIHLVFSASGNNDLEMAFYESTVVTSNGSQMAVVGLNRYRSLPPSTMVYRAPTITTIGNLIYNDFRAWGVTPSEIAHPVEWILRPDTNYLIRTINRAGGVQPIYTTASWYEAL